MITLIPMKNYCQYCLIFLAIHYVRGVIQPQISRRSATPNELREQLNPEFYHYSSSNENGKPKQMRLQTNEDNELSDIFRNAPLEMERRHFTFSEQLNSTNRAVCRELSDDNSAGKDLLSAFGIDRLRDSGLRVIRGSNDLQRAFSIAKQSPISFLRLPNNRLFPFGLPKTFGIETTFRLPQTTGKRWTLINILRKDGSVLLKLSFESFHPTGVQLQLHYLDIFGMRRSAYVDLSVYVKKFHPFKWYKLHASFGIERLDVYINCQFIESTKLSPRASLKSYSSGLTELFKSDQSTSISQSIKIDVQWFMFMCDEERAKRDECSELNSYMGQSKNQCKQTCPKGEKGEKGIAGNSYFGANGRNGKKGERGAKGKRGARGDKGKRGGRGYPGVPGGMGEPGLDGERGMKGEPGEIRFVDVNTAQTEKGNKGDRGYTGIRGSKGVKGDIGPVGPSAKGFDEVLDSIRTLETKYNNVQIKVKRNEELWKKNERKQVTTEKGDTGDVGPKGSTGAKGPKGEKGMKGQCVDRKIFHGESEKGTQGPRGPIGLPGQKGERGPIGYMGFPGHPGKTGNRGPLGPRGKAGSPGIPGQSGAPGPSVSMDTIRNIVMQLLEERIEEYSLRFKGPPGPPGIGKTGNKGEPGTKGVRGDRGYTGTQGEPGMPGVPGHPGPTGPIGPPGSHGPKGVKGDCDESFVRVPTSSNKVLRGSKGTAGEKGKKGDNGVPGPPGRRGVEGELGPIGPTGECNCIPVEIANHLLPMLQEKMLQIIQTKLMSTNHDNYDGDEVDDAELLRSRLFRRTSNFLEMLRNSNIQLENATSFPNKKPNNHFTPQMFRLIYSNDTDVGEPLRLEYTPKLNPLDRLTKVMLNGWKTSNRKHIETWNFNPQQSREFHRRRSLALRLRQRQQLKQNNLKKNFNNDKE
ncbi:hypothetical protein SNEBB_009821 [Seison nebaliae]|nr:hypothetical protein SNEBB_009821 [Seison nebaliae]